MNISKYMLLIAAWVAAFRGAPEAAGICSTLGIMIVLWQMRSPRCPKCFHKMVHYMTNRWDCECGEKIYINQ